MNTEDRLHHELGLKRLSRSWAKLEIVLGLAAAALGAVAALRPPDSIVQLGTGGLLGGVVLMMLGAYLAMAGHRSHIYQSQNRLAAWIASQLGDR